MLHFLKNMSPPKYFIVDFAILSPLRLVRTNSSCIVCPKARFPPAHPCATASQRNYGERLMISKAVLDGAQPTPALSFPHGISPSILHLNDSGLDLWKACNVNKTTNLQTLFTSSENKMWFLIDWKNHCKKNTLLHVTARDGKTCWF